jgi:hypothetical protein
MIDVLIVNINVKNNVLIVKKEFVMLVMLKDGKFRIILVLLIVVINILY